MDQYQRVALAGFDVAGLAMAEGDIFVLKRGRGGHPKVLRSPCQPPGRRPSSWNLRLKYSWDFTSASRNCGVPSSSIVRCGSLALAQTSSGTVPWGTSLRSEAMPGREFISLYSVAPSRDRYQL